jgi:putative hydrolase of the HAD superfamily
MTSLAQPEPAALLLDAGYTLIFPDGNRIAAAARGAGVAIEAAAIDAVEETMRREVAAYSWPTSPQSRTPSRGAAFFARFLALAGVPGAAAERAGAAVWAAHLERNVWARVGAGVPQALARLRSAGLRLAVVSNSEGTVRAVLDDIDLLRYIDTVVDSWDVGVSKPDPAIFQVALARLNVAAAEAIMVGDTPATDIAGARAVGLRTALIDPLGLYPDHDGPRFAGLAELARALCA